jgi:transcriptional regulator with XRE-family HTH domain
MLGADIRMLRGAKTQQEVADGSGLHVTTVQKIEGGEHEPQARTLMLLAKGLGVSPGKLIEGEAWKHLLGEDSPAKEPEKDS